MKYIIIVILPFLLSCEHEKIYIVPPEVDIIIKTFEEEAGVRGLKISVDDIIVSMVPNEEIPDAYARIKESKQGAIRIRINEMRWGEFYNYPLMREGVIFHELAHKVLNRGHITEGLSLMNTDSPYLYNYTEHRTAMLDELFGATPK